MALYKLDEDTGEAIRIDFDTWREWHDGIDPKTLIIAQHDIIEVKNEHVKAVAVDALKHPYHSGRVLAKVVTKLNSSEPENVAPWETGVEGQIPDFHSRNRGQAIQAHRSIVNMQIKKHGGRILI